MSKGADSAPSARPPASPRPVHAAMPLIAPAAATMIDANTVAPSPTSTAPSAATAAEADAETTHAEHMALTTFKGMANRPGDNHCFLNCVLQILWHLELFRNQFLDRHQDSANSTKQPPDAPSLLPHHKTDRASKVIAALGEVFHDLAVEGGSPVVDCDPLRIALSEESEGDRRFELNQMDDAVECYEEVLRSLHEGEKGSAAVAILTKRTSSFSTSSSSLVAREITAKTAPMDVCKPPCLVHEVMAMSVQEQVLCGCGARSEPIMFDKFIQYVPSALLLRDDLQKQSRIKLRQLELISGMSLTTDGGEANDAPGAKLNVPKSLNYEIIDFGQLLGLVLTNETKICSDFGTRCKFKCTSMRPLLINAPSVFSIGISWHTPNLPVEDLDSFLLAMAPVISLGDVFQTISSPGKNTLNASKRNAFVAQVPLTKADPTSTSTRAGAQLGNNETLSGGRGKKSLLLQGMIAYYGLHYVAFFFSDKEKTWMMFDDAKVKVVGPHFSDLISKCRRGRYQPSVLFYQTCLSTKAKLIFQEYIVRRLTREGDFVRNPMNGVTIQIEEPTNATNGDGENADIHMLEVGPLDASKRFGSDSGTLSADEKLARELQLQFEREAQEELERARKYKVAGGKRNMTREEATLFLNIHQHQREKATDFKIARVQLRVSVMGMSMKGKQERLMVMSKNNFAFYHTTKDIDLFHPKTIIYLNMVSLMEEKSMTIKGGSPSTEVMRLRSGTTTFEIAFHSELEKAAWLHELLIQLRPEEFAQAHEEEDSLIGLFNIDPQQSMQKAMSESKICVCGRPVQCLCSQCHLQAYCSRHCQKLHWRIHMSYCMAPVDSSHHHTIHSASSSPRASAAFPQDGDVHVRSGDDASIKPSSSGAANGSRGTSANTTTSNNNNGNNALISGASKAYKTMRGLVGLAPTPSNPPPNRAQTLTVTQNGPSHTTVAEPSSHHDTQGGNQQ